MKYEMTIRARKIGINTLITVITVITAVLLPQLFHFIGGLCGLGSSFGERLLPMHLPIIFIGLYSGKYVGLAAGFLTPIISHLLSGMPKISILPFIVIELLAYGVSAGCLKDIKMAIAIKVLLIQVIGRLIRSAAILFSIYCLNNSNVNVSIITSSVVTGVWGIALQLILIPLAICWANNISKKTENKDVF